MAACGGACQPRGDVLDWVLLKEERKGGMLIMAASSKDCAKKVSLYWRERTVDTGGETPN